MHLGFNGQTFIPGQRICCFFYGQQYGCSIFETGLISLFYALFHISDVSVKLAMLTMWTAGILFFYKALTSIKQGNNSLAFIVTLLFIVSPAWAAWSMKARGGYLSAFLLTSVILYIIFNPALVKKNVVLFFTGILLVLLYECQPLFLPGLLPLLLYWLFKNDAKRKIVFVFLGAIIPFLTFIQLKKYASNFYSIVPFQLGWSYFKVIGWMPSYIYGHLTGYYYLDATYPPSVAAIVLAVIFMLIISVIIILGTVTIFRYILFKTKISDPLFPVATLSVLATICLTIFRGNSTYRYLMPLTGYALVAVFLLIPQIKKKYLAQAFLSVMVATGSIAIVQFYHYKFNYTSKSQLASTISFALNNHIHCAFAGGLLEWQTMFYSNEAIICRCTSNTDRYEQYVDTVNSAWKANPENTAIIDFAFNHDNLIADGGQKIDNGYVIFLNPDRKLLEKYGYQFGE
jgi:hypothetical protein